MRNALFLTVLAFLSIFSASAHAEDPPTVGVENPAVSPDGRSLAVAHGGHIYVIDLQTGSARILADVGNPQEHPAWSSDGNEVAFSALEDDHFRIYIVSAADGSIREPLATTDRDSHARQPAWAGENIVFVQQARDGSGSDLVVAEAQGSLRKLTSHEAVDTMPSVSPDGSQVAFVSDRNGDEEIWVIPIEGGDATRLTFSRGEDLYPSWSPDGQRIAYSTEREGERYLAVIEAMGGEPVLFHRGGGQPAWSTDGKSIILAKLPPMPPSYNGNPTRINDWERSTLFPNHGAFELFRVPAPAPLESRSRVTLKPIESRRERNLRVFDNVVTTHRRLYYPKGQAREEWNALAERLRREAEEATHESELEAVVDRLVAERPLIRNEARSGRGVVSSGHPLATDAGLDVLRRGGNVVDAAIAVSFMLGVTEMDASGIGGDGMMLIHLRNSGKTVAIDYKDQVPSRATFDNPALVENGRLKNHGPTAMNIPGAVAGMELAYRKYGSGNIAWSDLIAPAARAAAEGVEVTPGVAGSVAKGEQYLKKYPAAARIFLPGGKPVQAGEILVNSDYATTLQAIAEEGADAFYRGSIAEAIVRDMRANGGIITAQDLAQYRAIEREPLVGHYRDFEILTAPPPASAGAPLLQILHILEYYPMARTAHYRSHVDSLHYMVEAWKSISRRRLVADPHIWEVDLSEVLSREWAKARFDKIDPKRASPGPDMPVDESELEDYRKERISTGTTAAVVADAEGNMVAFTQTLSTWGGAFYVSEGLGFLYNNHLRGSRPRPGRFGALTPLARSSTANCGTLVFRRQGEERIPFMAIGAAGNAWITASVYEVLTNIIDFGLSPQEAMESPRFLTSRKQFPPDRPPIPARIFYEQGIEGKVIAEMRERGHIMQPMGMKGELVMGYASVAVVDLENGEVLAGAEPRRSHYAGGVQ